MSELYLIHHGIEGQKWGVRRFQNPDGTLTAEGRARYLKGVKYGKNISVRKKDDEDFYRVSKKGVKGDFMIDEETLFNTEKAAYEAVINDISESYGLSMEQVNKIIDSFTDEDYEEIQESINEIMDDTISNVIDKALGKKPKTPPKPKYTQEQAIDKIYEDLEKKYPNFDDFDQDKQDELFFKYANSSGLYKYM